MRGRTEALKCVSSSKCLVACARPSPGACIMVVFVSVHCNMSNKMYDSLENCLRPGVSPIRILFAARKTASYHQHRAYPAIRHVLAHTDVP